MTPPTTTERFASVSPEVQNDHGVTVDLSDAVLCCITVWTLVRFGLEDRGEGCRVDYIGVGPEGLGKVEAQDQQGETTSASIILLRPC